MANTGFKGVDVRQTGNQLVFRELLLDANGVEVTTGTATLSLYELESDGDVKSYDFNDNTFKTTALTTATANMVLQQGNNNTVDLGIWTYALATLTGFTKDGIYFQKVNHASASPVNKWREFQYGGGQGDEKYTAGATGVAYQQVDMQEIIGTAPTESGAGRLAGAFTTFFNVASPVLTTASVNQTGDSYAIVNSGTFGNAAIKTETASIQSDTNDIQARLPAALAGGKMDSSVSNMTAAALAQFFTLDSGTTYAGAVAGSVIKEIVTNVIGAASTPAQIATAVWQDATASDFTTAGSIGKTLGGSLGTSVFTTGKVNEVALVDVLTTYTSNTPQTGDSYAIVNSGTFGNAAIKTETASIQSDTNDIQTRLPASLVSGRMDASVGAMAADTITASALATNAVDEIVDATWDEAISGHLTAGSTGKTLSNAGAGTDPWATALPGAYIAGTAGYILGTNLNATISSRMASGNVTIAGYAAGQDPATLVFAGTVETGFTFKQSIRIIAAATAGAETGGPDGPQFASLDGSRLDTVKGTADEDGNRSGVTYNA